MQAKLLTTDDLVNAYRLEGLRFGVGGKKGYRLSEFNSVRFNWEEVIKWLKQKQQK